jgi:hypothetical protein
MGSMGGAGWLGNSGANLLDNVLGLPCDSILIGQEAWKQVRNWWCSYYDCAVVLWVAHHTS